MKNNSVKKKILASEKKQMKFSVSFYLMCFDKDIKFKYTFVVTFYDNSFFPTPSHPNPKKNSAHFLHWSKIKKEFFGEMKKQYNVRAHKKFNNNRGEQQNIIILI